MTLKPDNTFKPCERRLWWFFVGLIALAIILTLISAIGMSVTSWK